ncbi:unnamed protein product [Effrenium voratum]|nr:unnamed protein product [Effrenium voratum]
MMPMHLIMSARRLTFSILRFCTQVPVYWGAVAQWQRASPEHGEEDSNMAATTAPSTSPVRARILPPHLQHRFDSLASTVPDSEDVDPEADVVKAEAKDTALDKADDCAVEVEMETMETEPKAKEEAPQERHWAFELLHWLQNACASCAEVPCRRS